MIPQRCGRPEMNRIYTGATGAKRTGRFDRPDAERPGRRGVASRTLRGQSGSSSEQERAEQLREDRETVRLHTTRARRWARMAPNSKRALSGQERAGPGGFPVARKTLVARSSTRSQGRSGYPRWHSVAMKAASRQGRPGQPRGHRVVVKKKSSR